MVKREIFPFNEVILQISLLFDLMVHVTIYVSLNTRAIYHGIKFLVYVFILPVRFLEINIP